MLDEANGSFQLRVQDRGFTLLHLSIKIRLTGLFKSFLFFSFHSFQAFEGKQEDVRSSFCAWTTRAPLHGCWVVAVNTAHRRIPCGSDEFKDDLFFQRHCIGHRTIGPLGQRGLCLLGLIDPHGWRCKGSSWLFPGNREARGRQKLGRPGRVRNSSKKFKEKKRLHMKCERL